MTTRIRPLGAAILEMPKRVFELWVSPDVVGSDALAASFREQYALWAWFTLQARSHDGRVNRS